MWVFHADPTSHFDTDPNPDRDPTRCFIHVGRKSRFLNFFIYSNASSHCFLFLVSVKCVINFSILDIMFDFSGKVYFSFHSVGIYFKVHIRIRRNDADSNGSVSTTLL
jgi:hypothetical protein